MRITGNGTEASKLTLRILSENPNAAIGCKGTFYSGEDHECGNITISNLRINAFTETAGTSFEGSAIGTGGGDGSRKCGDITITDAHIVALPGRGAASIGFGCPKGNDMTNTTYEMGDITIKGSVIESTILQGPNYEYPAHIGGGAVEAERYLVGGISISTDKSGTEFFANFNGGTKANDEVIVGFPGRTREWLIRWRTGSTNYFKIPWDLVTRLP